MTPRRSPGFPYGPGRRLPDELPSIAPGPLQPPPPAEPWPWRRGLLWLLFLAPFFFASYGFANAWAARHGTAGVVVFDWESHIPFLPWTIVPYWSIDLIYGLSFLLCGTRQATDRHAFRLLTAQVVAVACFLAFPLRFSFERPATDGLFGWMFAVLTGFDQPFNQAPSLHIALLVILWAHFAAAARGPWRWAVHGAAASIGLSVLTTYQHHFIDVPSGALAGAFCLWLWPEGAPSPLAHPRLTRVPARRRLAGYYLLAAGLCLAGASRGGAALWLLWPAVSLGLVAGNYAVFGAAGFQKEEGRLSWGATLLLAPYLAAAWLNSRLWTWRHPQPDEIMDGVWLGRLPGAREMQGYRFAAVLDLAAELPAPQGDWIYTQHPWLDLVPPDTDQLAHAAYRIARLRRQGPVLVCCALGYSRSASAVAAWLLATGRAASVDQAIAAIAAHRPRLMLGNAHRAALATLLPAEDSRA